MPDECKAVFQSKVELKSVSHDLSPVVFLEQVFDDAIVKDMVEQSIRCLRSN